jgi:hypothetical protein
MRLKRFFNPKSLDLKDLQELRKVFVDWFDGNDSSAYRLIYPHEVVTFRTIGEVQVHIRDFGLPQGVFHRRASVGGREAVFDGTDPSAISIEAFSAQRSADKFINAIVKSLGLTSHAPQPEPPLRTLATAFVGVPFIDAGKKYAAELIELLKAVDIDARTAVEYHAEDFREKIFRFIDESNLVFVIAIPHDDLNFIISEATYAQTKGRPLFILEEDGTNFKPALVGSDYERAKFSKGHLSETFTKILQGIQHLRRGSTSSAALR